MARFAVKYTETFARLYYVEADDFDQACNKLADEILYGNVDAPDDCYDTIYEDLSDVIAMHVLMDDNRLDVK